MATREDLVNTRDKIMTVYLPDLPSQWFTHR